MRYGQSLKNKVRQLRFAGWSLNQIHKETRVPITTIRTWIFDIKLSKEQLNILNQRVQKALQKGRKKAQKAQRDERLIKEKEFISQGKKGIGKLSSRELFIAGVALYWAEGFKNRHERRLGFCNSDPEMISFYIKWLEKSLGANKKDIIARLTLNVSYKKKAEEIEKYWAQLTGIPSNQFTKTFYQTSKWKKQYNTDSYHGVLRIHVKDSLDHLLRMKGWIEGLKSAKIINNLPG